MLWAALVAVGVGIVSMTIFGARLTRRPHDAHHLEIDAETDPADPWAAWKPRPFEEIDRPRPRLWPLLAALTGLVLVGAGFAGAQRTLWAPVAAPAEPTPHPYILEVEVSPTPAPTLAPTPVPTAAPAAAAPTPAPVVRTAAPTMAPQPATPAPSAAAGPGPTLTGSASCSGGELTATYNASSDAGLKWLAVYIDGDIAKGGPISGTSHSGSHSQAATSGPHDVEVSVEDKDGQTSRRQMRAVCP